MLDPLIDLLNSRTPIYPPFGSILVIVGPLPARVACRALERLARHARARLARPAPEHDRPRGDGQDAQPEAARDPRLDDPRGSHLRRLRHGDRSLDRPARGRDRPADRDRGGVLPHHRRRVRGPEGARRHHRGPDDVHGALVLRRGHRHGQRGPRASGRRRGPLAATHEAALGHGRGHPHPQLADPGRPGAAARRQGARDRALRQQARRRRAARARRSPRSCRSDRRRSSAGRGSSRSTSSRSASPGSASARRSLRAASGSSKGFFSDLLKEQAPDSLIVHGPVVLAVDDRATWSFARASGATRGSFSRARARPTAGVHLAPGPPQSAR